MPERWRHPDNGYPLNAVYGFSRWLIDLLAAQPVKLVLAAFDESLGQCFRNTLYADYKSSRELPDDALAFQLDTCKQVCHHLGVPVRASNTFEADDLLASAAFKCREAGIPAWILSADKDLAQLLVNEQDKLWDYDRKPALDRAIFTREHGFDPVRVGEMLALTGDPVDDIPGIPGIGVKTAAALLRQFDSLEALLAQPAAIAESGIRGAKKLAAKVASMEEQVRLARQLTALREDALPGAGLDDFQWRGVSADAEGFFEDAGLGALANRLRRSGLLP